MLLLIAVSAFAQTREPNSAVSLMFAVDGKKIPCGSMRVQLNLDSVLIVPQLTPSGFIVPAEFNKSPSDWSDDEKVAVRVNCGGFKFRFLLHPSWVTPGLWEVGIAYPPFWIERFRYTTAIEQGTWISYLMSECDGCDPGVETMVSHPNPPASLLGSLLREQPTASGGNARDIAYSLAVFKVQYRKNREYLVELLNTCLDRPKDSPEDEVCDAKLLDYLTNLYWRGDEGLLKPLLQLADSRKDVINEVGTFYGQLLDRHTTAALKTMQSLSISKQRTVCKLAGEDDLSMNPPKLERVELRLRAEHDEVADRCLQEAKTGAGSTP